MPMPATVGQLRTKVSEMEIGDYIRFTFDYGDWIKSFIPTDDYSIECNVVGESLTSGHRRLYLVKVAKGLLVADRVVRHSLSWDSINGFKYIQGIPKDFGNIIPTMTSNNSPSGVASASNNQDSPSYGAFRAFDKGASAQKYPWQTSGTKQGWLQYEFETPKVITGYSIDPKFDYPNCSPKTWTFEGSNDGITFKVLHQVQNQTGWKAGEIRKFSFFNQESFKMYRINATENDGGTVLAILELEMYETTGIIRSLTGGVAYADANGNKATIPLSPQTGGWPTNNEWDKYIINFPKELIQEGRTLDDIFHWNGIAAWCQETPINGLNGTGINTYRVHRGRLSIKDVNMGVSSASVNFIGFRPVFQYIE